MMDVKKYASWKNIIILFIVQHFLETILSKKSLELFEITKGKTAFDVTFLFGVDYVNTYIQALGEVGVKIYLQNLLTLDLLYPISYGVGGLLLFTKLFEGKKQVISFAPVIAGLFDILENLSVVSALTLYPQNPVFISYLIILFSHMKWIFVILQIPILLYALYHFAKKKLK